MFFFILVYSIWWSEILLWCKMYSTISHTVWHTPYILTFSVLKCVDVVWMQKWGKALQNISFLLSLSSEEMLPSPCCGWGRNTVWRWRLWNRYVTTQSNFHLADSLIFTAFKNMEEGCWRYHSWNHSREDSGRTDRMVLNMWHMSVNKPKQRVFTLQDTDYMSGCSFRSATHSKLPKLKATESSLLLPKGQMAWARFPRSEWIKSEYTVYTRFVRLLKCVCRLNGNVCFSPFLICEAKDERCFTYPGWSY